ncbi:MAG: transcription elongation factor GreB [Deltaproteobacteria bacterium]|nr:transcription elongation factor GreB [Deltaproteobacteria bacterium]
MASLNYITPEGLARIQTELKKLLYDERPKMVKTVAWAAANGDRSENADYTYGKKRLREIDRRIRFLQKRLDNIEVVDPKTVTHAHISFAATVTLEDEEGEQATYMIVGEDEIDAAQGKISWKSPLAKALLGKKQGDAFAFKRPKGVVELEVIKIEYK